ncbi:methylenetetrahydrofolate reductase C-terminal domain-containing protein [uncultured Methanolobus sp.]|uniref:methylenetetrahydrofolate reductase C-terminal domain-containing protein n=1 Tax=uncultured Methanolobus sp. TaxID=218300 RepID=UPI0029C80B2D|nr:methylenetetrahydrofolate reductase C-terminal domain-containing protein [uncultured Methanolobus sp.]
MIISSAKPFEEILELLKGEDDIFVIGCNACAAKQHLGGEPEVTEMYQHLEEAGKHVVGWVIPSAACSVASFDSLIEKNPAIKEAKTILVMACGSGVSIISRLADTPVYPSNNTQSLGGHSQGEVVPELCAMCGDCNIYYFGGICPKGQCPKQLLNGPCGGSIDGKCEVDPEKDCVWELIYRKLERTGRLDLLEKVWDAEEEVTE